MRAPVSDSSFLRAAYTVTVVRALSWGWNPLVGGEGLVDIGSNPHVTTSKWPDVLGAPFSGTARG